MFERSVRVEHGRAAGDLKPCPIQWLDNFAMRNFTNDAVFDDTLPVGDGVLEIGNRVPLEQLRAAMQEWFRRKGYIQPEEELRIRLT